MIVAALVVLVVGLGAAAFYVINGGWQTAAQKDYQFQHEVGPIVAAQHGRTSALEHENQLRRERGQPLLEMPKDRHTSAQEQRQKLEELQQKLSGQRGNGGGGN
jgi:multidrug resistance efflux pump